jgi:putative ATP-dependent endonuclease of the OLD family
MPAIRNLSIRNFRGIASLDWDPHPGMNAIIGPGDSCKTTILEALDLVIGGRRGSFTDADFHQLETGNPIVIDVTVGICRRKS